jgi:hypothetical protein
MLRYEFGAVKTLSGQSAMSLKIINRSKGGDNCDIMYMNSSNFYVQW